MPVLNAAYGPTAHTLASPTTAVEVPLSHAKTWRARITNTHSTRTITAITLAESPLGSGYGPESALLGSLAPGASLDVQGSEDCAAKARFTFTVAGDGEVTIEMAGV